MYCMGLSDLLSSRCGKDYILVATYFLVLIISENARNHALLSPKLQKSSELSIFLFFCCCCC